MTAHPGFTTGSPSPSAPASDLLSDVLRAVRLTGAVFVSIDATGQWAIEGPPGVAIGPLIRPGVEDVVQFHAIASGSCWGGLLDERPVQLHAGDVLVLPQSSRHRLSSAPAMPGDPVQVRPDPSSRLPLPVRLGDGSGTRCEVICGFLGCEAGPFKPLLAALPRWMLVERAAEKGATLARLIELAREELSGSNPGRESMLSRLAELMFIEAMRRYIAASPGETGWLAGVSDHLVGRSIAALHARPERPWTLDSLAREVGTSRSVLAERFVALVGMPPMQYLARWRMQIASELLSGTRASLAEIAHRLGYGSEAALSRAFKRIVGASPAHWRDGKKGSGVADAPPRPRLVATG